jgi:hypothetical protein
VLLEAVAGIGMLAILTAALHAFSFAALVVQLRSETSWHATGLARSVVERDAGEEVPLDEPSAGLWRGLTTGPAALEIDVEQRRASVPDMGCGGRRFDDVVRVRIGVDGTAGSSDSVPLIRLVSSGWPPDRRTVPAGLPIEGARLLLGDAVGPGVQILATPMMEGASSADVTASGDSCIELGPLVAGRNAITVLADDGQRLVDRSHRTAVGSDRSLTVFSGSVRAQLELSPAASLLVDVDADGARLSDASSSGGLAWLIRDDDHRRARAIGEEGDVHPGEVTVVVSACRNPDAPASSAPVVLAPGAVSEVTVKLAVVSIVGVDLWPDATLSVIRTTGCGDESGLRPTLMWTGGLHDGMRIALPHGEWEGRLETATGTRITSPVRIPAGVPETTVSLS